MQIKCGIKTLCLVFLSCIIIGLCLTVFTETETTEYFNLNRIYNFSARQISSQAPLPREQDSDSKLNSTENGNPEEARSVFSRMMGTFDWETYQKVLQSQNVIEIDFWLEKLIRILQYFLIMEPKVPVNTQCKAPDLIPPEKLNCSWVGYGNGFSGKLNEKPPRIGILIQLGFHVDVLEIYLNEVYDVVDQFIIIESTKSHYRTLRKALMWEDVKNQERFLKFAPKITHLLIDDSETARANQIFRSGVASNAMWNMEMLQEKIRWTKFLNWNEATNFFAEDDLLGFGDADEIPARRTIHMLKHCSLKGSAVDIGIWFPFGNINYAFASDYPVPDHAHTLGDPTFWKLKFAKQHFKSTKQPPGRNRGKSGNYVLGGIHMTFYGYLPSLLMRYITCSECGPGMWNIEKTVAAIKSDDIRKLELEHSAVPTEFQPRVVKLKKIRHEMAEIAILPWFYSCNRERYPAWEGKHDSRLDR